MSSPNVKERKMICSLWSSVEIDVVVKSKVLISGLYFCCQTSVCQNWILDEVDALKNDMVESAYQGADKSEFTSSLLLEAVSNTMDAVNALK
jgi:hypothetical protein